MTILFCLEHRTADEILTDLRAKKSIYNLLETPGGMAHGGRSVHNDPRLVQKDPYIWKPFLFKKERTPSKTIITVIIPLYDTKDTAVSNKEERETLVKPLDSTSVITSCEKETSLETASASIATPDSKSADVVLPQNAPVEHEEQVHDLRNVLSKHDSHKSNPSKKNSGDLITQSSICPTSKNKSKISNLSSTSFSDVTEKLPDLRKILKRNSNTSQNTTMTNIALSASDSKLVETQMKKLDIKSQSIPQCSKSDSASHSDHESVPHKSRSTASQSDSSSYVEDLQNELFEDVMELDSLNAPSSNAPELKTSNRSVESKHRDDLRHMLNRNTIQPTTFNSSERRHTENPKIGDLRHVLKSSGKRKQQFAEPISSSSESEPENKRQRKLKDKDAVPKVLKKEFHLATPPTFPRQSQSIPLSVNKPKHPGVVEKMMTDTVIISSDEEDFEPKDAGVSTKWSKETSSHHCSEKKSCYTPVSSGEEGEVLSGEDNEECSSRKRHKSMPSLTSQCYLVPESLPAVTGHPARPSALSRLSVVSAASGGVVIPETAALTNPGKILPPQQ